MDDIFFLLKKVGLHDKEINIYLALLEGGPLSVREIAKLSGINRGTSYDILKTLIDKGLVSYYDKTNKRLFSCEDPERLKEYYESQMQDFEKMKNSLEVLISKLKSHQKLPNKPIVRFFEGDMGIKTILLDVIKSLKNEKDKTYYVYSSYNIRNFLYKSFKNFTQERIKNKIFVKVIAIGQGGAKQNLSERKWLDKEKQGTPTYKIIYKNKIALISLVNEKPIGTIIDDPYLYETEKYTFEFLWKKI